MLDARIAIVNHESGGQLENLLGSLAQAAQVARDAVRVQTIVVDNASRDGSWRAADRAPLPVTLQRNDENVGYGAAANQALAGAPEPWLLVLNADLLLPRLFLARLAIRLGELDERVGIVGPALRDPDGGAQPSVGTRPTLLRTLAGLLRTRRTRKYVSPGEHRHGEVDWLTGACLAIRRECWEKLGGFDERFFLYYEDVDLCLRTAELGWACHFDPELAVVHRAPLAQRGVPAALLPTLRHSQLQYFHLHRPRWEFLALSGITALWSAWSQLTGSGASEPGAHDPDWKLIRGLPARVARGDPAPRPRTQLAGGGMPSGVSSG